MFVCVCVFFVCMCDVCFCVCVCGVCVVCVHILCVFYVCVCFTYLYKYLCFFHLQDRLYKQINSRETLSSELNNSFALKYSLNSTIGALTKKLETLNQTLRLLCEQFKDVSTFKIDTVSAFTDIR